MEEAEIEKRTPLPGMERGYALSPMATIRRAYHAENEGEVSVFMRTKILISKQELTPVDVIDRGISRVESFPRFALETGFALRVVQLRRDFQSLLSSAASLNPGRPVSRFFIIDPHDALLGILKGASTLEELAITWRALRTRFELAQRYLDKYESEYRAERESEILLSPVSTESGLYEALTGFSDGPSSNLTKLAYLYEAIPHLKASAPTDDTNWLADFEAPEALESAFPPREAEERPSTVYYSAEGNRLERALPSNTSWKAGKDYSPPEESNDRRSRSRKRVSIASPEGKGKGREVGEDERVREPGAETTLDSLEYDEQETEDARIVERDPVTARRTAATSYSILAPNTPYKSADEFFQVPKTARGIPSSTAVPNVDAPDPLYGMAASSYFGTSRIGDSISQARTRQPHGPTDDNRFERWTGNTPVQLLGVDSKMLGGIHLLICLEGPIRVERIIQRTELTMIREEKNVMCLVKTKDSQVKEEERNGDSQCNQEVEATLQTQEEMMTHRTAKKDEEEEDILQTFQEEAEAEEGHLLVLIEATVREVEDLLEAEIQVAAPQEAQEIHQGTREMTRKKKPLRRSGRNRLTVPWCRPSTRN
ncbi:hypothetical protein B0H11DRAFT_1938461 [Mycena galericulata]|nr:hypothetical protein B0H11DRAFT_1938461 [Mycena galericulata]